MPRSIGDGGRGEVGQGCGRRCQVLSLPSAPSPPPSRPLVTDDDFEGHAPATIRRLLQEASGTPYIATASTFACLVTDRWRMAADSIGEPARAEIAYLQPGEVGAVEEGASRRRDEKLPRQWRRR